MKKHQNLFLAVLVVFFSVYAIWDYYREESDKVNKSERSLLLPLKTDQVKEIEIIKPENKIKLQRGQFGWQIVEPIQDWADNDFVEDFVAAATADKELAEIESRDINQFGLKNPTAEFIMTDNQGIRKSFKLSSKQNFEGSHYAQRANDERIILVTNVWATRANKTITEYRDRRLLRSKIASVQNITVRNSHGQFNLSTQDGKWVSTTNLNWNLDQNLVRQMLQTLVEAKAIEFIEDKEIKISELNKYQLAKPELSIDLQLSDEKWSGQLGQVKDKHRYFYVQGKKSMIYQVDEASLARFNTVQLIDLRDTKLPFQFDKSLVTEIKFTGALKKWKMIKNKDEWQVLDQFDKPQNGKAKAPQLLESLLFSQASQFLNQKVKSLVLNNQIQLVNAKNEIVWWIKWSEEVEPHLIDQNKKMRLAQTSNSSEIFALDEATIHAWGLEELVVPEIKK